MIKHINSDEINKLKSNLIHLTKYKKYLTNKKGYNDFYSGEQSLDKALDLYINMTTCKHMSNLYQERNQCLIQYLIQNSIIEENHSDTLDSYFSDGEDDEEDGIYDVYDAAEDITEILDYMFTNADKDYVVTRISDLTNYEKVIPEFEGVRKRIEECLDTFEDKDSFEDEEEYEDYLQDTFNDVFEDDAYIYCLKNCSLTENQIKSINSFSYNNYQGFKTEVYNENNNLYLTISDYSIYLVLKKEFILLFICYLLKLIRK